MIIKIPKGIILAAFILAFVFLFTIASNATEKFYWSKNADLQEVTLHAVCYGNCIFVAVGEDGMIKTSDDGWQWSSQYTGVSDDLYGIIWGGNQFIAIGDRGTVLTSSDGKEWMLRDSGTTVLLTDVIWDGTKYLIVSPSSLILSSTDGVTWSCMSYDSNPMFGIEYNKGQYVAAGRNFISTSSDGVSWNTLELSEEYDFRDVAYGAGSYVVVGIKNKENDQASSVVFVSDDLKKWSFVESSSDGLMDGVSFCKDRFFCFGSGVSAASIQNGSKWIFLPDSAGYIGGIVYGDNKYIRVGSLGLTEISGNGVAWEPAEPSIQCDISEIIWANNLFVGVGGYGIGYGNCTILTSPDGKTWANSFVYNMALNDVIWDGTRYIAVGTGSQVLTSKDGTIWESGFIPGYSYLEGIAWNGQQYLVVGDGGIVYTSPDGTKWVEQSSGVTDPLGGVVWNGKCFIAVGGGYDYCIILKSTDGITWNKVYYGNKYTGKLQGVIWANNQFLAYGSVGTILVSKDGSSWTPVDSRAHFGINDIVWNGTYYFYVADEGYMGMSPDGIIWYTVESDTDIALYTIAWNGESLLAGGNYTSVFTVIPKDIIKVKVDNIPIAFDVAPISRDGRTLVPLRAIFDALGVTISWNESTKTIYATTDGFNMILHVGSKIASVNGRTVSLDVPAVNYSGRVLVPTRFIAESLGADVDWDAETRTVIIETH